VENAPAIRETAFHPCDYPLKLLILPMFPLGLDYPFDI